MKKLFVFMWLGCLLLVIGALFWHHEWKYTLPTPVPENYQPVALGTFVDLDDRISFPQQHQPVFLHFYNPKCPCSKFNTPHFQALVKQYGHKINFGVVVLSKNKTYTEEEFQDKLDLQIPVVFDPRLAVACGVYSTPQAVLLDADQHLYFRGNYNVSRYCTDKETNFAQQAIDSLLNETTNPVFAAAAFKSYGCELPNCESTSQ